MSAGAGVFPLAAVVAHYGYLAVAGTVFVEGFGMPAPGQAAIMAAGVYAGNGHLRLPLVMMVAFTAAMAGDSLGYLLGRRLGRERVLRAGRFVFLTETRFDRLATFMHLRGPLVVASARFVDGLRQLNGVIAGVVGMPWRRFVMYNAIGAAAWVGVWATVGYVAGDHLTTVVATLARNGWYLLAIAALVGAGYLAVRRLLRRPLTGRSTPRPPRSQGSRGAAAPLQRWVAAR